MRSVKITFHLTLCVRGRKDAVELRCVNSIPFLPRKDDLIAALENDDYRKVEEVYWSKGEGFAVWFVYETRLIEPCLLKTYKGFGWREVI